MDGSIKADVSTKWGPRPINQFMRVLQVLESMGGGTRKHLELLARGLKSRGVDVTLALPFERPYDPKAALMDYTFPHLMRSQGFRVEQFHMVHGRISPRFDALALYELTRFIRHEHFDVVHTHSAKAGVLGRLAARLACSPAIVHTPYSLPFRTELRQGSRYYLYYGLEKTLAAFTDTIIATSLAEQKEIASSGLISRDRVPLIHNCFDLERYDFSHGQSKTFKEALGWDRSRSVVGTVARLSPQKGLLSLVECAGIVKQKLPKIQFVVVGDGEQRITIEQKVATLALTQNFTLVGNRADYLLFMRAFDVFAFPSLWEGLPYAPIESMAIGTPVVASAATGTIDLIIHERTGLLVEIGDAQAMAAAILRLLGDANLASNLAYQARKYVEDNFNGDHPVDQTLHLYDQLYTSKRAVDTKL